MRILGVDPGLRRTGFGVIDLVGSRLTYVASGTIVGDPAAGKTASTASSSLVRTFIKR